MEKQAKKGNLKKGRKKTGGRQKGVQNKTTRTVKEAIALALEGTQDNLKEWLVKAGKQSGQAGITAWATLAEFVQPKLSRTDTRVKSTSVIKVTMKKAEDGE